MNIPPRKEDRYFTYLRVQRKLWLLLGVNSLSHLKKIDQKNLVLPALPDLYLFRCMIMSSLVLYNAEILQLVGIPIL
jgi:hypothetical protein